jgi:hypothetical protein
MRGIALLIAPMGSTGWMRSRALGAFTAVLAGLLAVGAVVVVWPFVA